MHSAGRYTRFPVHEWAVDAGAAVETCLEAGHPQARAWQRGGETVLGPTLGTYLPGPRTRSMYGRALSGGAGRRSGLHSTRLPDCVARIRGPRGSQWTRGGATAPVGSAQRTAWGV